MGDLPTIKLTFEQLAELDNIRYNNATESWTDRQLNELYRKILGDEKAEVLQKAAVEGNRIVLELGSETRIPPARFIVIRHAGAVDEN